MRNLDGQVAVVTGAGKGIGKAIALGLAKAGTSVAVIGRSEEQLAETVRQIDDLGFRAISVTADISDPEAVEWMFHEVEEELGSVENGTVIAAK
jgi:NAD(P)-dependent dehydrogenase (short-subunit alcohol dehydrogenase family)